MLPTGTTYMNLSILMEDEHDVQLLPCHLDLDPYRTFGAMGLLLYLDIILQWWYSSMHLLIGFLSGAMLVHNKGVDDHAPALMTVVSLCVVDGNIHQLWKSVLLSSNFQHGVPMSH
jgi:hypothetical protein